MLPLLQADEIKRAVVDYLRSTFDFEEANLDQAFEDFLQNERRGMFKGPFIQLRLPFEKVTERSDKEILDKALVVKPSFDPYHHQFVSFTKLSTRNNHQPEPVILTTGTGSGKTESFLFPLLDYCYQHRETPGIKAIILYPMNALATDQARRIAEEIYNFKDKDGTPILQGKIRAGLFIGEGKDKNGVRHTRMGEDHIIEDRDTLVQSPPDILLTNFKMLDFALLQARFHNLWSHNFRHKDLLKFIVLDELHTYDGAKGSDVANLIRRLKLKLNISQNQIVPVGTSATMGGGQQGKLELVDFFSKVFGVTVTEDAVIEEQRQEPEDFFADTLVPPALNFSAIESCTFLENDTYESYLKRQLDFWGYTNLNPAELGEALKQNQWFYELLRISKSQVTEIKGLLRQWKVRLDVNIANNEIHLLLGSLLALITYAKEQSGTKLFPFLYLQITYWLRSLTKIVRKVQPTPVFEWESELNPNDEVKTLPPYFCRECGGTGWVGIKKENNAHFEDDLSQTRQQFMANNNNKNIYFVSSLEHRSYQEIYASDYAHSGDEIDGYMHPHSLSIYDHKDTPEYFKVLGTRIVEGNKIDKVCPHCNARNTLALIGTGVPTLESIATAQVLATATDPTSDSQRKLLAFTNGVQDAAHQAGFIENRNFRFGMRHAIQAILKDTSRPLSLPELYEQFIAYWKANADDTGNQDREAFYYKFFPPDCETRIELEDYRNKNGKFSAAFDKEFDNRMTWEIWSEFSYSAAIGRTLEKTGASATHFDKDVLGDVYDQMKYWLDQNELGDVIDKEPFLQFLNGFLHRLRTKGGVDHKYLKKYRTERTNSYLIGHRGNVNRQFFLMRNFGPSSRLPKFLTLAYGPNTKAFDVVQAQRNDNWFSAYFKKCFLVIAANEKELINDFYAQLLEYLDSNRILDKKVAAGITNYGLSENNIYVSPNVASYQCDSCGHELNTAYEGSELMEGMKCLQYRCAGSYKSFVNTQLDYYRMVYNRGRSLRIYAKDHTGLIDRNEREKLEYDFKKQPKQNSTNVLVATSTLEMGIDIGDLNVTFNSSLPPETSNYLQRIGRAGRSSGTSMILNLAGRDEHDLYYFQDPQDMMSGEVKTPACYLEAKDILKRHFMAFCFDRWASQNPTDHKIPPLMRMLRIKSLKPGDPNFLFQQIASFIEGNKTTLYEDFTQQYQDQLGTNSYSLQTIFEELSSGRFVNQLMRIHQDVLDELNYYWNKMKLVKKQLKDLPQTGNETTILKNEKRALSNAIYNINRRNVIEYLTNIGVLPNYAFPETGVTLNAQIKRKITIDGNTEYKYEDFNEIVRSSASALTELAPSNTFYSQGYKLRSEGLEIRSQEEYEEYRFCSNCDHIKKEIDVPDSEKSKCPVCSHGSWSSLNNRKLMVKLQGVVSINDKESSKITDTSDERERLFYNKSVHIKIDQSSSKGAHVLKRVPFGIEFFQNVEYMEINTGMREENFFGTREIEINGEKHPQVGFIVCKTCGKSTAKPISQRELQQRKRSYHFPYCSNRDITYDANSPDEVFNEIYLYRKFNTEALSVLLPVQEFRSSEKIALFKAGLQLGLKKYFKGRPDHILIRENEIFNKTSNRRDKYLVLYETIPGGTGYLSKIFDTAIFTEILKKAYEEIKFCSCKQEGKDGCYRCMYTYGNQYERTVLSRLEAEELFSNIIDKADEWNAMDSLQNAASFGNNEESDLEWKFITYLEDLSKKFIGSSFKTENEKGLKIYRFKLVYGTKEIVHKIFPQNLGATLQGVKLKTRPDFVMKCVSISDNNKQWSLDEVETIKDIAIYLDGYEYHASENHPRFPSDVAIRNSIVSSNKYHQWIFTWNDFKEANLNEKDPIGAFQNEQEIALKFLRKHPTFSGYQIADFFLNNNLSRFFHLVINPMTTINLKNWSSLILFNCQKKMLDVFFEPNDVEQILLEKSLENVNPSKPNLKSFVYVNGISLTEEARFEILIRPEDFKLEAFGSFQYIDSWEKANWEKFWSVYNLLQFHNIFIHSGELEEYNSENLPDESNQAILDNFDEELHPIVLELIQKNIDFNSEYDFDLMEDNIIIAQAELGSHSKKFVINPFDEESKKVFTQHGYQIVTPQTFKLD